MLGDRESIGVNKVFCTLHHIDCLLEALRFNCCTGHYTIRLNNITVFAKLDTWKRASIFDKCHRFTCGTNSLEVTEGLTHPVKSTTVLAQSFDRLGTTRNEH